jgi:hypothetical protein
MIMTTRTVEIDDDLDERIDGVMDEIKSKLIDEVENDLDAYGSFDNFLDHGLEYDGTIHELVDSAVPVYTSDVDGLFYLYGGELEQAYDDAGCYSEKPDNYKEVCIYFYIEQEVHRILREEIEPVFEEWLELPTQEDEDGEEDVTVRTVELLKDWLGVE